MIFSTSVFVFVYVPLYYLTRFRRLEERFNTTVNAVLMMASGGMLYALINLGNSTNIAGSVNASYTFMLHNSESLVAANENLISPLEGDQIALDFHKSTSELFNHIEDVKTNLISKVNDVPVDKAAGMDILEIKDPNDNIRTRHHFVNGNHKYSLNNLLKKIDVYNEKITKVFPDKLERKIAIEKLQLDRTIQSVVLQELSQIQLHIVTIENSYLSANSIK